MQGFVGSLNVSVAASVLLAEAARQRRSRRPEWSPTKDAVWEAWLERESSGHGSGRRDILDP